jgi:cell division protein FtsW
MSASGTDMAAPVGSARRAGPVVAPPRFYVLGGLIAVLTLFGLVMVLSASSVAAFHDQHIGSPWYYFIKQSLLAGVGFAACYGVARCDYHRLRRWIPLVVLVAWLATMACFVPGVGRTVNGATSWVAFGPIQGQPSELLKLAMLLYCADLLARRSERITDPHSTIGPCLLVLGASSAMVVAQRDLGTAVVLCAIVLLTLFVAGCPLRPLAKTVMWLGAAGWMFVMREGYRRARFTAFRHQAAEAGRFGYQLQQSKIAISSGGLSGVGLGASRGKWGYLPEAHTDFIAAVVGEELGFIGVAVMVSLLLGFVLVGARVAQRAPDRFGMLVAAGITAWVAVQVTINLGAAVGLMPITGLPLPFVSFGPSSLVCLMMASGLLLNVARQGRFS